MKFIPATRSGRPPQPNSHAPKRATARLSHHAVCTSSTVAESATHPHGKPFFHTITFSPAPNLASSPPVLIAAHGVCMFASLRTAPSARHLHAFIVPSAQFRAYTASASAMANCYFDLAADEKPLGRVVLYPPPPSPPVAKPALFRDAIGVNWGLRLMCGVANCMMM
jgi:hypothetical protein